MTRIAIALILLLLSLPVTHAFAAEPVATVATTTTANSAAAATTATPPASADAGGMTRATPAPQKNKAPYFYAAYAVVWAVLFGYAAWIARRVKALEEKLGR